MRARVFRTARNLSLAAPLALVLLAGIANADQFLLIPEQYPGFPMYSRGIATRGVPTELSDWCSSVFYRPPECVPEDFNLLTVVDFDLLDASSAAVCPFVMEGFALWKDGEDPEINRPYYWELREAEGATVPLWFFTTEDKYRAIQNGVLKIQEFDKMGSLLKGRARHFREIFNLDAPPGARVLEIIASGDLEDGRQFFMHFEAGSDGVEHLTVRFN